MTYGELSYKAKKLYTKGKITICEYLEMTKPLDREIEQEPKTGRWIEERTYMKCPNCNDIWHYEENQTERFKFCPTCGMRIKQ